MWWNVQNAYDTLGHHHTPDPEISSDKDEDTFWPCDFGSVLDESDRYVVMQYIGMEDSAGTEIYEGDIVTYQYDPAKSPFIIAYGKSHPMFVTNYPCGKTFIPSLEDCAGFEVVGNIYQNPELLEDG